MRILVFGGSGMLGHKLVQILSREFEVWATIRGKFADVERFGMFEPERTVESVDVMDFESVRRSIEIVQPDVVINAVGVIKQVPTAQDVLPTLAINSVFPKRLAVLSREFGYRFITISTDCVFNGERGNYSETDVANAKDLYGISKFLGEAADNRSLSIRTSVIGRELVTAHSIVEWFLSQRGSGVKGYTQAIYSGFPTITLAHIISDLISDHQGLHGIYHISSNPISKFDLLNLLNKYYKANAMIEPDEDYIVDRSLNSSKFRLATAFTPIGWDQMIEQMAADPTPYESWRL